MYFRFGAAIVLAVVIAVVGVALEKESLAYRREISRQHYQLDELVEQYAKLRLKAHRLGAPQRTIESLPQARRPRRDETVREALAEPLAPVTIPRTTRKWSGPLDSPWLR